MTVPKIITLLTKVYHLQAHTSLHDVSVRNFSFPGATAQDDLDDQLGRFFAVCPPKKAPDSKPALDPTNTCYVFSLGINDCGRTDEDDLDEIVEKILDAAHRLYTKAGARDFIFIDLPPIDRSPRYVFYLLYILPTIPYVHSSVRVLTRDAKATVFCFSAYAVFTDILNNPVDYEFEEDDTTYEGGAIWADELHATSAMHKIMANRLLQRMG
ncbi:hypothetical protein B0H10DRAFT_1844566 [Mycena sp. CBHHK59/15]|nr:hypothetical protein B0H10DRAFT_1844566 [Mycena sp. CBHHK59/15]